MLNKVLSVHIFSHIACALQTFQLLFKTILINTQFFTYVSLSYQIFSLKMTVNLPNFISKSFLQEIFERNFADGKTLTVKSFWGEWATKKGDNYASDMYRIHVDIEGINMSKPVLLKVIIIKDKKIVQMQ